MFVADLRGLLQDCEFGETLSDMRQDRLVCRVNHPRIQKCLLQENFKVRQCREDSARYGNSRKEFPGNPGPSLTASLQKSDDVVHQTQGDVVNAKLKCFRCKGAYSPSSCPYQKAKCWKCKKQGHVARATKNSGFAGRAKGNRTHQVRADSLPQARATESRGSDSDSERLY